MDAYYRKTRRPTAALSNSLKRPPPVAEAKEPADDAGRKDKPKSNATNSIFTITALKTTPQKLDRVAARETSAVSSAGSPAKTPSPPPRPRPTTPTNARIARPKLPPPVKRKLVPNEVREARRPSRVTPRDLFRSIHPLDKNNEETKAKNKRGEGKDKINDSNNNADNDCAQTATTTATVDIVGSFGLKRLNLPATPPATPIKQQVKRLPPEPQSCPESPSKIAAGPLKGVSTSLLDLIRAKEARAKEITPELERQRELLSIAPEIARIVPTVFTASKKDFLLYDKVVDKCFKGLNAAYTTETIKASLDLMNKVVPEWVSVVDISKGRFMRYNKDKFTLPQILLAIKKYQRDKIIVK